MTSRWGQAALDIFTVGLPFCAFKLVTGTIALHTAFAPLGYALLALGTVDLVLDTLNLVALVAYCGHLVGKFPHEDAEGDGDTEHLRADTVRWILEIHFVDRAAAIGGVQEALLLESDP